MYTLDFHQAKTIRNSIINEKGCDLFSRIEEKSAEKALKI